MNKTDEILERMYEKLGISKDSEFCKTYNIKPSTVSSWRNRDSIPYDLILEISRNANFSLDYVLKGVIKKEEINYKVELLKTIEELKPKQIEYLYHIAKSKKLEIK